MARSTRWAILAIASLGWSGAVEAKTATLDYTDGVEGCPSEPSFRALVAARLGYDPFVASAPDAVVVQFDARRDQLRARLEIRRAGQARPAVRELESGDGACEALAAAVATSVALALDPLGRGPALAKTSTTAPVVAPTLTATTARAPLRGRPLILIDEYPPKAEAPTPSGLSVQASGLLNFGIGPGTALGGAIGLEGYWGRWRAGIEGRFETTSSVRVDSGDHLQVTVLSAALAPCVSAEPLVVCAIARAGAFQARAAEVESQALQSSLFAAAGISAGLSIAVGSMFFVRPAISVELPIVRTSLTIEDAAVWTAPPVMISASLGLGLVVL